MFYKWLRYFIRDFRRGVKLAELVAFSAFVTAAALPGCARWYAADADQEVYGLIDRRQEQAIGIRSDASAGEPMAPPRVGTEGYAFNPHPIDPEVPESFARRSSEAGDEPVPASGPSTVSATQPEEAALEMGFHEVIAYAFLHNRDFQRQKEDLFLAGLDLSLERFLWTPQFLAEIRANFADFGQIRDFDRAMDAVAEVAAEQRLPLGGRLTAQVISTFMRDLGQHITTGESSQIILGAEIPLLRGAGLVALETRFQAERDLIYSVRQFERQRRELFVAIATNYFRLIAQEQAIRNAEFSVTSFEEDFERAKALNNAGRTDILDVQRAEQSLLTNLSDVVQARARYENDLDAFKVQDLGMPVEEALEVLDDETEFPWSNVPESEAIETALRYRLTLLTDLDLVADARRRSRNAANELLPDLNLDASVVFDTSPGQTNLYYFQDERATWRGGATLGLPVNRKRERNDYRAALIGVRRAERNYEESQDEVRRQVRRAIRVYRQAEETLRIQETNIELAIQRREAAGIRFELGLVGNRDKVEAENDLRRARDDYANALAEYKAAILAFRRDTGTLRIDEEGNWVELGG